MVSQKNNKLGIENLVAVCVDAIEVARDCAEVFADGVQVTDGLVLLKDIPKLRNVVEKRRDALAELKDLTTAEAEMVEIRIVAQTGLPNTGKFSLVRKSFSLARRSYTIIDNVIDLIEEARDLFHPVSMQEA